MNTMPRKLLLTAATLAIAATATVPAYAVSFNLIDTGGAGAGTRARQGFEVATGYWSSVLTDNAVVI